MSVTDPDAPNDAHTYTLVDDAGGRFDIVGDKIVVKNRALLNYEQQPTSYPVIVRVTDAGGLALAKQFTISVTDENEAPTAIALSGTGIGENASDGATVGTLSVTDPDAPNGLHVYTLLDDAGGRFAIVGDKIVVKNGALLDYEQATSHVVTVRVTDAGNLHVDRQFNIFLTDVNETPAPDSLKPVNLAGGPGAETLSGGGADDLLVGAGGNDALRGESGNDILKGGLGKDILTGGTGKDMFFFDTKPTKTNLDTVTDYNAVDDALYLDNKYFPKLGMKGSTAKPQKLDKQFFSLNKPKDKTDYLFYVKKTGTVFYDVDGSGSKAAVAVVVLKNKPALTAAEFFVV